MTGLVQLYQRLSARAMSYFLRAERSSVTHTVRTEITVEHEHRVWVLRENLRDSAAWPGRPGNEPTEPVRGDAVPTLPASPSAKPPIEGESQ